MLRKGGKTSAEKVAKLPPGSISKDTMVSSSNGPLCGEVVRTLRNQDTVSAMLMLMLTCLPTLDVNMYIRTYVCTNIYSTYCTYVRTYYTYPVCWKQIIRNVLHPSIRTYVLHIRI